MLGPWKQRQWCQAAVTLGPWAALDCELFRGREVQFAVSRPGKGDAQKVKAQSES